MYVTGPGVVVCTYLPGLHMEVDHDIYYLGRFSVLISESPRPRPQFALPCMTRSCPDPRTAHYEVCVVTQHLSHVVCHLRYPLSRALPHVDDRSLPQAQSKLVGNPRNIWRNHAFIGPPLMWGHSHFWQTGVYFAVRTSWSSSRFCSLPCGDKDIPRESLCTSEVLTLNVQQLK